MYRQLFKRILDVVAAGSGLIFLSPIMLVTAIAVKLEDGGPALFSQQRVGMNGHTFRVYKFRSMPVNTGDVPSAMAHNLEVTRVGQVIRRTNIDELPQLVNILLGDMSVVGPRPALPRQVELNEMRRENGALSCRPGLTGLAQVNSYDGMPETEKAAWDGKYAASVSFGRDVAIILRTVLYLAKRPPAY